MRRLLTIKKLAVPCQPFLCCAARPRLTWRTRFGAHVMTQTKSVRVCGANRAHCNGAEWKQAVRTLLEKGCFRLQGFLAVPYGTLYITLKGSKKNHFKVQNGQNMGKHWSSTEPFGAFKIKEPLNHIRDSQEPLWSTLFLIVYPKATSSSPHLDIRAHGASG